MMFVLRENSICCRRENPLSSFFQLRSIQLWKWPFLQEGKHMPGALTFVFAFSLYNNNVR